MEDTSENKKDKRNKKPLKHVSVGLLAHVDAGKTTLSEAMLYTSGSIRSLGRVDHGDAFLDTDAQERARGITIFSKQAEFTWKDKQFTLLDTPGHVDFSAEMERTLQVLDYAILVISGADGVQGHTRTLWILLKKYQVPVILFINKMDQPQAHKDSLLGELKSELDEGCIDFGGSRTEQFQEEIAMCGENALEQFLEKGRVEQEEICGLIARRRVFPCYFGSALKLQGVEELLDGLVRDTCCPVYPREFGAKVYKIVRDSQGNRLTYLKITGGSLKVRDIPDGQEKVNQIRIYSGEKFEAVKEAEAGRLCAVTGLTTTYPGQGLGREKASGMPLLEPVLTYQVMLPEGCDPAALLPKLRQLEEEEPELHIVWNETLQEIQVQMMGEVQREILKKQIQERFGAAVEFGSGNIVYKETIAGSVEGVGHFEPLRHYAEVHLLLEPGEPGTGLQFASECSVEILDQNWQKLVLTHLEEKEHRGVLTGASITDMKITLVSGRAHQKHTEGGDFRQATYRAVRQGLMQAESVLLEPYYRFRLEIPADMVGRAMTDIERMHGSMETPQTQGKTAVLTGSAPVAEMREYQKEVAAYAKGNGRLACTLEGYRPCRNAEEVAAAAGYDPERDVENPPDSVFCSHGAGFVVKWDQVPEHMHLDSILKPQVEGGYKEASGHRDKTARRQEGIVEEPWIDAEEIDRILTKTFDANKKEKFIPRKGISGQSRQPWQNGPFRQSRRESSSAVSRTYQKKDSREDYLLVDGYNIIFAWEDLKELAAVNIDGARGKLLDILCDYQGTKGCGLIVVFDAYRVKGHDTEFLDYHNIHVVYTREAETADQYIEKFAHENKGKYRIMVATSDGLEQIIIQGQGCELMSARELQEEVRRSRSILAEEYLEQHRGAGTRLQEYLPKLPDEESGKS